VADERYSEVTELAVTARYEAAELAVAAGRYREAHALVRRVLDVDPMREAAWRLEMRISDALGDAQGVIRGYQQCERALARLDTTPSDSTRQLLASLRR